MSWTWTKSRHFRGTNVEFFADPFSFNNRITIYQDAAGTDPTSMWFAFDFTSSTLTFVGVNLDESSEWYVTSAGQEFTEANILGGEFDVFFQGNPRQANDQIVGSSFYLGFRSERWEFPDPDLPDFEINPLYGWVSVEVQGPMLMMIDNAITHEGSGIVVGTAQAIPEPVPTAFLPCLAIFLFMRSRSPCFEVAQGPFNLCSEGAKVKRVAYRQ